MIVDPIIRCNSVKMGLTITMEALYKKLFYRVSEKLNVRPKSVLTVG